MPDMPQITEKMLDGMHNALKAEEEKVKKLRIQGEIESLKRIISKQKQL